MKIVLLTVFLFGFGAFAKKPNLNSLLNRRNVQANVAGTQRDSSGPNWNDPAAKMDTLQLIAAQGYHANEYSVITDDGFILALHRIEAPRHKNAPPAGTKRGVPVLLQHGLESSSVCWVTDLWNQSLPFILADQGYDVWLGNVRGNTYTRKHVNLSPDTEQFWKWSFDEMAKYDIPAMINYITETTNYPKIFYVGHSQGTMVGFYEFSSNPTFANNKIRAFFALAPVGTIGSITSKVKAIAPFTVELEVIFALIGYKDFLPDNGPIAKLRNKICEDGSQDPLEKDICNNFYYFITGGPSDTLQNKTRLAVKMEHFPAGTSTQNIVHFGQMINSNKCQKFDWGFIENEIKYGSRKPPQYDLTKLSVPTVIFHGGQDKLADPTDVAWLKTQIQSALVGDFYVDDYTHTDFISAVNAPNVIFNHILEIMKKY